VLLNMHPPWQKPPPWKFPPGRTVSNESDFPGTTLETPRSDHHTPNLRGDNDIRPTGDRSPAHTGNDHFPRPSRHASTYRLPAHRLPAETAGQRPVDRGTPPRPRRPGVSGLLTEFTEEPPMKEKLPNRIPGGIPIPDGPKWNAPVDIASLIRIAHALHQWQSPDRSHRDR